MRKTILSAMIAGMLVAGGAAQAALTFNFHGAGDAGIGQVNSFDWLPTTFLAKDANTAIDHFSAGDCVATPSLCLFDVYTHAKLGAYTGSPGSYDQSSLKELTIVGKFQERVTAAGFIGTSALATFETTGEGYLEMYFGASNADQLTGFGFNDGAQIARLTGVTAGLSGSFLIDTTKAPVALDQHVGSSLPTDDYPGQLTVVGTGSQGQPLFFGVAAGGIELDPSFFLTTITGFSMGFDQISIGLPISASEPSDCFNTTANGGIGSALGSAVAAGSRCDATHTTADYLGQAHVPGEGYLPVVGPINGFLVPGTDSPDFVAGSDFVSVVTGVPEPGSIALLGMALGMLGVGASRRRSKQGA